MKMQSLTAVAILAASSLTLGNALAQTGAPAGMSQPKAGQKSPVAEADNASASASSSQMSPKKRAAPKKHSAGEKSPVAEADNASAKPPKGAMSSKDQEKGPAPKP